MAKRTKEDSKVEVAIPEVEEIAGVDEATDPEEVRCQCGFGPLPEGATRCKVCKALWDRDKRKAKAKAKAKAKRKLRKSPEVAEDRRLASGIAADVLAREELQSLSDRRLRFVIAQIAYRLNDSLPSAEAVEVRQSLHVEGVGTEAHATYHVEPV